MRALVLCVLLAGCSANKEFADAVKEFNERCIGTLSAEFVYQPSLFNNGYLKLSCSEVKK
jgi:hypothetical protein